MQAVILAAGQGLRLRPLTETRPKALVDVQGRPLIEYILEALPQEITEIFIVVGYRKDQIMDALGGRWGDRPIRYVVQEDPTGTGAALSLLRDRIRGKFLVVNGDDLYAQEDLERLIAHPLAMLIFPTPEPSPSSALLDEQGHFVGLEAGAPEMEVKNRVCGAYVLDERFFRYPLSEITVHGKTEYSLPHTLIRMAADLPIKTEMAQFWQPVGTMEELEVARKRSKWVVGRM